MIEEKVINELKTAVPKFLDSSKPNDLEAYVTAWRAAESNGVTPLVLFPESTEQVSQAIKICNDNNVKIFPQGGNTGLVGGSIPDETGEGIVICLRLMNQIEQISPDNTSVKLQAGVVIDKLKEAADEQGLLYPMEFGATGSAQIGSSIATNAGGANAIKYGVTRDLVLGMTVVTGIGEVLKLGGTIKNTAGPQIEHLFIGSEGIFGIITEVEVKLFPKPNSKEVILAGLPNSQAAMKLLAQLKSAFGNQVNVFEIIDANGFSMSLALTETKNPLGEDYPFYVLAEIVSQNEVVTEQAQQVFAEAIEEKIVANAVFASSGKDQQELWSIREHVVIASKDSSQDRAVYFDTVVPVRNVSRFIDGAENILSKKYSEQLKQGEIKTIHFGHFGDGNIHFHIIQPKETHGGNFNILEQRSEIEQLILDFAINDLGGSGWAEHGIGSKNRSNLEKFSSPELIKIWRDLKKSLDPNNIMNPGRAIP